MDKIDMAMGNISDFYDDKLETILNGLTSLLEVLLMVFLGVVIVGIVLCMFLPIFKMVKLFLRIKKQIIHTGFNTLQTNKCILKSRLDDRS